MGTHWAAIAPVHYNQALPAGLTLPHRFADRVTLAEIPAWVTSEDVLNCLSYSSRNKLKWGARYCIAVDYEVDELGTSDKEELGRSIQGDMFDSIKYVDFALWLAQRTGFGFFCVIYGRQTNHEWRWKYLYEDEVKSTCPLPTYKGNQLNTADFQKASDLFLILQSLTHEGTLRMTTDAAAVALTQKDFLLRFLILWLVIESLFGPEDAREMTFRLSQRVALFLDENPPEARDIFAKVRLSYAWRSKLVHGLRLSKLTREKSRELITDLEDIVWRSLRKIFGDTERLKRFESKERETFLDDLAFESVKQFRTDATTHHV